MDIRGLFHRIPRLYSYRIPLINISDDGAVTGYRKSFSQCCLRSKLPSRRYISILDKTRACDYKMENMAMKSSGKEASRGELLKNYMLARGQKQGSSNALQLIKNQEALHKFNNLRKILVERFLNEKYHSNALIDRPKVIWNELANGKYFNQRARCYDDLKDNLNNSVDLHYYGNEMENSLNAIVFHIINSVLVELSVKSEFIKEGLSNVAPLGSVRTREDNNEIVTCKEKLTKLMGCLYNSDSPDVHFYILEALKNLDGLLLREVLGDLSRNIEIFDSVDFYRYNFDNFKSSQYLNYDHSDTLPFISAFQAIRFESEQKSNKQILREVKKIFTHYDDRNLLSHIKLALDLCLVLLKCQKYTPTVAFFNFLLKKFGELRLYHYQDIIYDYMIPFKYEQTVLAVEQEDNRIPKIGYQFRDLIQEEPSLFETVINYQTLRPNLGLCTLQGLLNFFDLAYISENEKVLLKSNLKDLIARSRFSHNREQFTQKLEYAFKSRDPIFVDFSCVYSAVVACVEHKEFTYIDLLFNKLLFHSVKIGDELKVALHLGEPCCVEKYGAEFLTESLSIMELKETLFNKHVFKLLLEASRSSDDIGRLMWLLPHLDDYLAKNLACAKVHLKRVERYLQKAIIWDSISEKERRSFHEADDGAMVDVELIERIYDTLSLFGIDGKLASYDTFLNFEATVPTRVREKQKEFDNNEIKKNDEERQKNDFSNSFYFSQNSTNN